ncbi:MAG: DUF3316 domain-containing protein [Muribaculaceae bacterium]|nr:DUF3316 domain-containing protein [Muribaculaceae bacterium]
MKSTAKHILAALLLSTAAGAAAQSEPAERPVLSAYTIEAGSAHLAETYLSPLKYSGWSTALSYERMQAMRFNPERWVMRLRGRLALERTVNPARNATLWGLGLDLGWGMMHRWQVAPRWTVMAGGSTDIDAGVLYNARNSNNPAAAKVSWTVNASAAAVLNTHIGRIPVCARYQAELPLTGVFFSPEYGELYYEIYLGNHKGLVRGAWPGNFFRLNNLATLDFRFGRTTLRTGYRCLVFSSKASHIVTRRITHSFVIGVTSEWLSLSAKDRTSRADAKIISALY